MVKRIGGQRLEWAVEIQPGVPVELKVHQSGTGPLVGNRRTSLIRGEGGFRHVLFAFLSIGNRSPGQQPSEKTPLRFTKLSRARITDLPPAQGWGAGGEFQEIFSKNLRGVFDAFFAFTTQHPLFSVIPAKARTQNRYVPVDCVSSEFSLCSPVRASLGFRFRWDCLGSVENRQAPIVPLAPVKSDKSKFQKSEKEQRTRFRTKRRVTRNGTSRKPDRGNSPLLHSSVLPVFSGLGWAYDEVCFCDRWVKAKRGKRLWKN
jgi:hypothetical protein